MMKLQKTHLLLLHCCGEICIHHQTQLPDFSHFPIRASAFATVIYSLETTAEQAEAVHKTKELVEAEEICDYKNLLPSSNEPPGKWDHLDKDIIKQKYIAVIGKLKVNASISSPTMNR